MHPEFRRVEAEFLKEAAAVVMPARLGERAPFGLEIDSGGEAERARVFAGFVNAFDAQEMDPREAVCAGEGLPA
jgi:hypothetical protein